MPEKLFSSMRIKASEKNISFEIISGGNDESEYYMKLKK